MPQIIYTDKSRNDLQRLADFISNVAPHVKDKMIDNLLGGISQLTANPRLGKPSDRALFRELIIPFGHSAYVVLYRYDEKNDIVIITRIRHGRENGFN